MPKDDVEVLSDDDSHGKRQTAAKSRAAKPDSDRSEEHVSDTTLELPGVDDKAAEEADESKPVSSLAKSEPQVEKPKVKSKAKPKALPKSKAAAKKKTLPPPKPKAAATKTLPPPKPKAAAKPKHDDASEEVRQPPMKRPAAARNNSEAATAAPKMKATKYMYHATQKWGIKLNGREQLTVRAFNKAVFNIGFGVVFFFLKVFTCFLLGFILLLDRARF